MSKKRRNHFVRGIGSIDRVPPTMETAVKLTPDHLRELEPEYQAAAVKIMEAHRIFVRGFAMKRQDGSTPSPLSGDQIKLDPGAIYKYLAWRERLGRMRMFYPMGAIFEMLDGVPPWECDRLIVRPPGTCGRFLIEVLALFIRMPLDAKPSWVLAIDNSKPSRMPEFQPARNGDYILD